MKMLDVQKDVTVYTFRFDQSELSQFGLRSEQIEYIKQKVWRQVWIEQDTNCITWFRFDFEDNDSWIKVTLSLTGNWG